METAKNSDEPRAPKPVRASERVSDLGADFYGQFELVTGGGVAARGYAGSLIEAGAPLHLVSLGDMYSGLATCDCQLPSDPRRFAVAVEHVNADTTVRFLRRYGSEVSSAGARVAIWFWELAALRPDWVQNTRHYDEIWVASEFGRRAVAAVTNTPVHVIPPPVELSPPAIDPIELRAKLGLQCDAFTFLYVFDYSSYVDRKNPRCLVEAYVDEFAPREGTALILKVSHGDPSSEGFQRMLHIAERRPDVHLVQEVLTGAQLRALFDVADCYVSPHRSEGFGLTVAEAMLCGRPVIATDWASTVDFVTPETAFPLDYSLVEIEKDTGPYLRGYVWADASQEHLRALMRTVLERPDEARARAAAGKRLIEERYSKQALGPRMRARLEALLDAMDGA